MNANELILLSQTSKGLNAEVKNTLLSGNRILIAQVFKFINDFPIPSSVVSRPDGIELDSVASQILYLTAVLQDAMQDFEGAQDTRNLASNILDFDTGLHKLNNVSNFARVAVKKARGKDMEGARSALARAPTTVNTNNFPLLVDAFIAIDDLERAKACIIKVKESTSDWEQLFKILQLQVLIKNLTGAKKTLIQLQNLVRRQYDTEGKGSRIELEWGVFYKTMKLVEIQISVGDWEGIQKNLPLIVDFKNEVKDSYLDIYDWIRKICVDLVKNDQKDLAMIIVQNILEKSEDCRQKGRGLLALAGVQAAMVTTFSVEKVKETLSSAMQDLPGFNQNPPTNSQPDNLSFLRKVATIQHQIGEHEEARATLAKGKKAGFDSVEFAKAQF